jgi:hypothetical protein
MAHQAVCPVISPRRAIAAKRGERGRAAEAAEWRVAMGHQAVPRPGGRATEAALERGRGRISPRPALARGRGRISPRPGPSWTYQHDDGQTI